VQGGFCGCGEKIEQCPFWSDVVARWVKQTNQNVLNNYIALQKKFESYRQLPRVFFENICKSQDFQQYSEYTFKLYESIKIVSGVPIIADASKNPVRVWALSKNPSIDLYLIHVLRDVRGVVWSSKKQYKKDCKTGLGWDVEPLPLWRTTMSWMIVNILSEFIRRKQPNNLLLRYEDLRNQPDQCLNMLGSFLNLDFSDIVNLLQAEEPMSINHLCAGNRLRMRKSIILDLGMNEEDNLSEREKNKIWRISSLVMKHYGYSK
jgi:hypothetical protein